MTGKNTETITGRWVTVTNGCEKPTGTGACVAYLAGVGLVLAYHTGSHWRWFHNNDPMAGVPTRFFELPSPEAAK